MSQALLSALTAGTPLDEFLAGAGHSAADDRLRDIGVGLALFGVLASVGVLAFLASVHRGPRREVQLLLRLAGGAGCLTLLGGIAELTGIARRFGVGLTDALDLDVSSAALLRILAGLLLVLGLFDDSVPATSDASEDQFRWLPSAASSFGIVGALLGAASFAFDGHTLTKGSRALHATADFAHVMSGGVWFGGVLALVVIAASRRRTRLDQPISAMVVRFSSIATLALLVVALAGAAMSLMIIDGFGDYTGTQWGRRLIVKVVVVAIAASIGAYNHFVVVPRLSADADDPTMTRRVNATLTVELLVLVLVVIATVFLLNGSTV